MLDQVGEKDGVAAGPHLTVFYYGAQLSYISLSATRKGVFCGSAAHAERRPWFGRMAAWAAMVGIFRGNLQECRFE
jgi:hypothetical protein